MFFDVDAIGAGVDGEAIVDNVRWRRKRRDGQENKVAGDLGYQNVDECIGQQIIWYIIQHGHQLRSSHRAPACLIDLVERRLLYAIFWS
jgi:hypothetical protein